MYRETVVGGVCVISIANVSVDRTRTSAETFWSSKRAAANDLDFKAMAAMPRVEGDFLATFVNLGRAVSCYQLDEELAKEGWELIRDPQGLAEMNEEDPDFADSYPNCTQWPDADGGYPCVAFGSLLGERSVVVSVLGGVWHSCWWFPCRPLK